MKKIIKKIYEKKTTLIIINIIAIILIIVITIGLIYAFTRN
ncbi:hypothetical protein [Spiroplasma endosymbiont of Polydrusus pterygomalis]